MHPLNQPERRKAFTNFVLFFFITSAFIIAAVLFSVQVPAMENQQLRAYKETVEKEHVFEERFIQQVNMTRVLLDSMEKEGVNVEFIDAKVAEKLTQLDGMVATDTVSTKELYNNVIESLSKLFQEKKKLRDATRKDVTLGEVRKENEDLRYKLKEAQNLILIYETTRRRD